MRLRPLILITIFVVGFFSCVPIIRYSSLGSGKNQEKINFGDFHIEVRVTGYHRYNQGNISFNIESKDSLTVWPKQLEVYYTEDSLSHFYKVYKGSKEYNKEAFQIRKGAEYFWYDVQGMTGARGDTMFFFGFHMFQCGDKFYDLDTLSFIVEGPPWWAGN